MPWYLFGILGALFDAGYYGCLKRFLSETDRYLLGSGVFLATSAVLAVASLIVGIPPTGPYLIPAVLATGSVNIVAALLYFRALEITDLSLSVPMISFTPIFLILTSFVILGEMPSGRGALGIVLIVSGSYILHSNPSSGGLFDPVRRMLSDRGVLYMLAVAFLFSISSNFDKVVVRNSDPYFGSMLIFLYVGTFFLLLFAARRKRLEIDFRSTTGGFLATGLMLALSAITINIAYTMQIVPYVISLKRFSIVFTVLVGGVLFREKNMARRLAGVLVMFAGVVLIVTA